MTIDLLSYPFLEGAPQLAGTYYSPIEAFRHGNYEVLKRVRGIIYAAVERKDFQQFLDVDYSNLLVYPCLRFVLKLVNNNMLTEYVGTLYSKYQASKIADLDTNDFLELCARIRFPIYLSSKPKEFAGIMFNYCSSLEQYVNAIHGLHDPSYKLVNQYLERGIVYFHRVRANRIVEHLVKTRVIALPEAVPELTGDPRVDKFLRKAQEKTEIIFKPYFNKENDKVVNTKAYPPCIKMVLNRLLEGINTTHQERMFITAFMNQIGMDEESIRKLFERQPDFDQEKTAYYVGHVLGKNYMPHGCDRLLSLNLCHPECDEHFRIKNPLVLYRKLARKRRD